MVLKSSGNTVNSSKTCGNSPICRHLKSFTALHRPYFDTITRERKQKDLSKNESFKNHCSSPRCICNNLGCLRGYLIGISHGCQCGSPAGFHSSETGVHWIHRRVYDCRRGGLRFGVWHGHWDQPADFSGEEVHKLRCAEGEHCAVLATWRILLQLSSRRSGQPILARMQCHHSLQALKFLIFHVVF